MTRFTDSPYERMMTRRPEGGKETSRPPSLPCVQRSWTTLAGESPVTVIASEPCS